MYKNIKYLLLIYLLSIFIFACQAPDSEADNDNNPPALEPPKNVYSYCIDKCFYITWNPVEGADYYKIYRQAGNGEKILIAERCEATYYVDCYTTWKTVRHFIEACNDDDTSQSASTEYISLYILNIKASRFQFNNRIEITWDEHKNASSYNIYRYVNKADINPIVTNVDALRYIDNYDEENPDTIEHDKAYYYKITYLDKKDNNEEKGLEGSGFILGVFSDKIDFYEPNDDFSLLSKSTSSFSDTQPPVIYSFGDEAGGVDSDIDWYLFYDEPKSFVINVSLPADTPFSNGDLKFQYKNPDSGEITPEQSINASSLFIININNDVPVDEDGKVSVYFKIFSDPVRLGSKDVSGTYYVEFTDNSL